MKLILLGSTGLVGSHVLDFAVADNNIDAITELVREPAPSRPKVFSPVVDFEHLPANAEWWQADALICCLGTTRAAAGSKKAFYRIDHDYPLMAAQLAHKFGTPTLALNSAKGADAFSLFFYNRVKGELERDMAAVGFASLTFVRPALLAGKRKESRPVEAVEQKLLSAVGPLLPPSIRVNPAEIVARAILTAAVESQPGTRVVPSADLIA